MPRAALGVHGCRCYKAAQNAGVTKERLGVHRCRRYRQHWVCTVVGATKAALGAGVTGWQRSRVRDLLRQAALSVRQYKVAVGKGLSCATI